MKKARLSLSGLSDELKRRRVYPVIVAYTVTSWIILQVGEVTFEPLGLPDWAMTGLVVAVIAGFPATLLLAWFFDIKAAGPSHPDTSSTTVADDQQSVAVLPFTDMSPEGDQGYFCQGIAEEILNALTRIPGLFVAARMSSFRFPVGSGDIREIGKALGVRAILEGSVRKSGKRVRVSVQLVKVADGYHLWSRRFDEELEDVFAIQDEIATGVAQAMLKTIQPVKTTTSSNITAYDYYLRGRQFFNRFRKLDLEYAVQMFRHAIDIDPDFAEAWAGYADCHSFLNMYADPRAAYREEATRASIRSLELDPALAEAHASRGLAYLVNEDYPMADKEFAKSLELNPSLYEAYYYYGRARFHQGDTEAAAELFKKASELNPADYQSRLLRVQILRGMGRRDQALAEAKAAVAVTETHLEWNPDDARALLLGAGSLQLLGETDRADTWLQRAYRIDPHDSVVLYNLACNLATTGKTGKALKYLQKAADSGTVSSSWMEHDEDLVSLRELPQYRAMLARLQAREVSDSANSSKIPPGQRLRQQDPG